MTQAPLFYRSVAALNRETHANTRIRTGPQAFGFAAGSHLVPAVFDEFPAACRHLPIMFVSTGTVPAPVFLVGVQPGESNLVGPDGQWRGGYIPAFVRRYPFILGEVEGSDPVVCVDEASGLLDDRHGDALFENGAETGLLRDKITLATEYAGAAKRTEAASRLLAEMELLTSSTLNFTRGGTASAAIHGLLVVDEAKLGRLPDEQVLRLHREGLLAPIYAHLLSLGAIGTLGDLAQPLN